MDSTTDWFEDWFDSPYYHVLYKHRDNEEAEDFLNALIQGIPLHPFSRILDVACGKGRHAMFLSRHGFDVTGFDLSEQSILHNLKHANERLHFFRHDMRDVFCVNCFDYVMNLFSSFGYFEKDIDNLHALRSSVTALRKGGTFIFDYANTLQVRKQLVPESAESIDGITFRIRKYIREPFIVKEIDLTDNGVTHHYREELRLFEPETLLKMMESCGLEIKSLYGDYALHPFDADRSNRLIVVATKK